MITENKDSNLHRSKHRLISKGMASHFKCLCQNGCLDSAFSNLKRVDKFIAIHNTSIEAFKMSYTVRN